jgi:hypothetical protein
MAVLTDIAPLNQISVLENGFYLCLIATDKTPPHIALIANGKYYSTSVRGVKLGVDYKTLIKIIVQKKTPTLFIQLDFKPNFIALNNAYVNYPKLTESESCLFPIRDYFQKERLTNEHWSFVFNAVDDLLTKKKVQKSYELYMATLIEENSFKLAEYTKDDIIALIKELKSLC